ncbi:MULTISPECIES: mechanosensitive ion channel domain-containing protein [unclassified Mesorhizobium]|uniref:mechanosensitive ion channel family protein n=1 Tax=unclassified Mesorhizobium TaxID=325217 RepID=UPI000FC9D642|nr:MULTISPECIES: mechanosensitive ion channel domain-containing protein [unclassified Mesorhizobium]RUU66640.1 mechanosensitive ion channel [Mesorhizobium sp. M7A.T.Ca.TU.009.01.1.1]RUU88519.1 mechanosensitive ion channel [Mesorhizobium sp. M7A.T.Ca.TU.009.01.1.2]RUT83822.1 mechanosensitive ion channel [Mesorhizobium sp. M7A.T.Ca.US.000.02.1.1]RUT94830.1 mechanosensitive ion channel [Mesorhizobium sp. M7A.T.Ca.US.000.02.2.1]RUU06226.1 mechanosensitive ion channel [Mesorhizobium sp. M7A.T.Ca.TU
MPIDPQNAFLSVQAGLAQLSTLIVSYSFSAIGAVILLIVGYIVAGLAERSIFAGLGHIHGFDATLRHFFSKIVRYAILILVTIMVLGQFGVQTASIIAAIGAIGLAIGLALQGTLQNIAAGIMLLALRPFRIGESVEVGSIAGTIEEIGLFATKLRTADGVYILAPNSTLWNQPVRNFSRNGVRRSDITLSIGSWNDIDRAQKTLLAIAAAERRVKREPAPIAFVSTLGDSTVSIALRYWTSSADFFATQTDLTKRAKQEFDSEGISIPLPPPEAPQPEARRQ